MRFSLGTLVIVSLWLALSLLVWLRGDAWVADRAPIPHVRDFINDYVFKKPMMTSPDGTRYFDPHVQYGIRLVHPYTGTEIYHFAPLLRKKLNPAVSQISEGFLDDDTVAIALLNDEKFKWRSNERLILRRRFPEWWWGHFYRVEVWAFLVLTGVLVGRGIRARRKVGPAQAILTDERA